MNVLEFTLLVSAGIVALAVGIDAGSQLWKDKQAEREAHWARIREAEELLYQAIQKRFEARMKAQTSETLELNVVTLREKPVGGRHRLTAA